MSNKKQIILTFDYEPYLGRKTGSASKCILEPTLALRHILKKHNAKAIFFVDVLYLKNLYKHPELKSDYTKIVEQIQELFKEGHYIFPHIHPHWNDVVFIENTRQFNLSNIKRYSLSSFDKNDIENMFNKSISFLKELGVSYEKWGYRAGGWCLQPFDLYKDIFKKHNIIYDFSVLPGYKNENSSQYFDYSNVKNTTPYFFSDFIEKPDLYGRFVEFPITTISFNRVTEVYNRLVKKYLWKTNDKGWGDGIGAQTNALKSINKKTEMITIDILNISKLSSYKRYLNENDYMHWISHPKMFTKHGLNIFDKFLKFAVKKHNLEFDFQKVNIAVNTGKNL